MKAVVYGATGWTGTLAARALEARGVELVLAGRDLPKLREASARLRSRPAVFPASIEDPDAVTASMRGASVLVNCAGPYVELATPLLDGALRAGCHYIDASGEHTFLKDAYARYDREAAARDLTFCPGFAAKGALGDWGVTVAARALGQADSGQLDEAAIAYAHGLREYFQPSAGSVLSAAGQGFLKPADDFDPRRSTIRAFHFPPPFSLGKALLVPGAEDVSVPRHKRGTIVRSYLSMAPGSPVNELWARGCTASLPWVPLFSELLKTRRRELEVALAKPRQGGDRDTFAVAIEVRSGDRVVRMGIATRDAYVVTADILAIGVLELTRGKPPRGVVPPSLVCDATRAMAELAEMGSVRVSRKTGNEPV